MRVLTESKRLILREIEFSDAEDLYEMDADEDVHLYIRNSPVKSLEEMQAAIEIIRKQYKENGIGRWAVVLKDSNECIGWAGLKYFNFPINKHINIYELGYRFKKKHWGKGYATESSKAVINYGFQQMQLKKIYAITNPKNEKSINVLIKLGFKFIENFSYEDLPACWFELNRKDRDIFIDN